MSKRDFRELLNKYATANREIGYYERGTEDTSGGDYKKARENKTKLEKEIIAYASNQSRVNRKSTEGKSKTN